MFTPFFGAPEGRPSAYGRGTTPASMRVHRLKAISIALAGSALVSPAVAILLDGSRQARDRRFAGSPCLPLAGRELPFAGSAVVFTSCGEAAEHAVRGFLRDAGAQGRRRLWRGNLYAIAHRARSRMGTQYAIARRRPLRGRDVPPAALRTSHSGDRAVRAQSAAGCSYDLIVTGEAGAISTLS